MHETYLSSIIQFILGKQLDRFSDAPSAIESRKRKVADDDINSDVCTSAQMYNHETDSSNTNSIEADSPYEDSIEADSPYADSIEADLSRVKRLGDKKIKYEYDCMTFINKTVHNGIYYDCKRHKGITQLPCTNRKA